MDMKKLLSQISQLEQEKTSILSESFTDDNEFINDEEPMPDSMETEQPRDQSRASDLIASIRQSLDNIAQEIGADGEEVTESAAPGQEEWIKDNKQKFIDQYGKEKGMEVLYATAWKRSKANESKEYGDTSVDEAPEYQNSPDECECDVDVIMKQGNDLNRRKKQFADKPKLGDNPMATESVDPHMPKYLKLLYESIMTDSPAASEEADTRFREELNHMFKRRGSLDPKTIHSVANFVAKGFSIDPSQLSVDWALKNFVGKTTGKPYGLRENVNTDESAIIEFCRDKMDKGMDWGKVCNMAAKAFNTTTKYINYVYDDFVNSDDYAMAESKKPKK